MTVTDVFLLTSLFYVLLWFYIGSLDDSDDDTEPYCHENDVSSGQFEIKLKTSIAGHSKPRPVPHCWVLQPGEFIGIIPEPIDTNIVC